MAWFDWIFGDHQSQANQIVILKDNLAIANDTIKNLQTAKNNLAAVNVELAKRAVNAETARDVMEAELNIWKGYEKPVFSFPSKAITHSYQIGALSKQVQIPIQEFIETGLWRIRQEIEKNDLFIKPKTFDRDYAKLYRYVKKKYLNYYNDSQVFGTAEYWMKPHEVLEVRKVDCDDIGNMIVSFARTAGCPADRILCTAGTTRGNEGHLTVYVKDSKGVWHHTNSTSSKSYDSLTEFPTKDDETDMMGLRSFHFSYNDVFAGNQFSFPEWKTEFNNSPISEVVKIGTGKK
jgi:hypothetical protein